MLAVAPPALTPPLSQAVLDERAHLLAYGAHMTAYCRRLQALTRAVGEGAPEWAALEMDAAGALRPMPAPRPRRVAIPFDAPTRQQTPQALADGAGKIVAERIRREQRDLRTMLAHLRVESAPAVDRIQAMQARTRAAMGRDSHKRAITRYLHPSPSLHDAEHDPAVYLIGQ